MSTPPTGLIDVHAHFVTEDYVQRARDAGYEQPDGMPGWPSWNLRSQLELMDRNGIERAILSISSPGVHFGDEAAARGLAREVNGFAASVVRRHPDRFGFLASLPLPDVSGSLIEIEHAFDDEGADGVALLTNARGTYLGDPAIEPVLAALDSRHTVVLIHPTSPPCSPTLPHPQPPPVAEFVFETTRTVLDLILGGSLERNPRLRIVVPHTGAALPLLTERVEAFARRLPELGAVRTAGSVRQALAGLWYDLAGTPVPRPLAALTGIVGVDRIVYGSDSCWTPAAAVDAQVDGLDQASVPAGNDTWRELTRRNTDALLSRPDTDRDRRSTS